MASSTLSYIDLESDSSSSLSTAITRKTPRFSASISKKRRHIDTSPGSSPEIPLGEVQKRNRPSLPKSETIALVPDITGPPLPPPFTEFSQLPQNLKDMVEDALGRRSRSPAQPEWASCRQYKGNINPRPSQYICHGERLTVSRVRLQGPYSKYEIQIVQGLHSEAVIIKFDARDTRPRFPFKERVPYWKWLGGVLWENSPSVWKVFEGFLQKSEVMGEITEHSETRNKNPDTPAPVQASRVSASRMVTLKLSSDSLKRLSRLHSDGIRPAHVGTNICKSGQADPPQIKKESTLTATEVVDLTSDDPPPNPVASDSKSLLSKAKSQIDASLPLYSATTFENAYKESHIFFNFSITIDGVKQVRSRPFARCDNVKKLFSEAEEVYHINTPGIKFKRVSCKVDTVEGHEVMVVRGDNDDFQALKRAILSAACWTSTLPAAQCHVEVRPF